MHFLSFVTAKMLIIFQMTDDIMDDREIQHVAVLKHTCPM